MKCKRRKSKTTNFRRANELLTWNALVSVSKAINFRENVLVFDVQINFGIFIYFVVVAFALWQTFPLIRVYIAFIAHLAKFKLKSMFSTTRQRIREKRASKTIFHCVCLLLFHFTSHMNMTVSDEEVHWICIRIYHRSNSDSSFHFFRLKIEFYEIFSLFVSR